LAELERCQGRLAACGVELVYLIELALDLFELRLEVERLDLEGLLVDGAGLVAVEQSILHVDQLRAAFGQDSLPLGLNKPGVAEAGLQRLAEPSGGRLGQPDGIQFLLDGSLDLALPPPHLRVSVARSVVAAAGVDVYLEAAFV